MSRFQKATREKLKLRMAIDGPSGSGKTFTALRMAFALAATGSGRVAVLDTEYKSARKYQGEKPDDWPFNFDVRELTTFAPTEYTSAIEEAGSEGYDVLILDSLSHAWAGKEGALELKDKQGGNSFTAWKTITPMHTRMIDAILSSPCHIFATMRSKTEYILEPNENGKMVPRRVGMAPVQRQGMEYEFDIYGSMDWANILTISKSRCRAVAGVVVSKPGVDFMRPVIEWLETGATPSANGLTRILGDEQLARLNALAQDLGLDAAKVAKGLSQYGVATFGELYAHQAVEVVAALETRKEQLSNRPVAASVQTATEQPAQVQQTSTDLPEQPSSSPDAHITPADGRRLADAIKKSGTTWETFAARYAIKRLGELPAMHLQDALAFLGKRQPGNDEPE